MRFPSAVLVVMLLSSSHQHEVVKRESGGEKRIVCYYTNWSVYRPGTAKFNPQNINPYLCTHLIYAFGGLDRENGLRPYDKYQDIEQGGYAKFTGLKTYNKALKTMLAIGGWNEGSARFSPLVADEERRREFVKNVVKFLRINHFDGLDLDWEYPAYRDGGKPKDKENYANLVQELREEFERESQKTGRPRLLLTMAVPAGIEYIDKGYDIPKLNKYLDFMNILSYDYHSAFEPSVNHHSPLYSTEEENEYNFDSQLTIDATVKHYLLKGADPGKLVLGIPTYGRSYTLFNPESTDLGAPSDGPGEQGDATREKGYLAYYEICENVNKGGWTVVQPKESALGPYAYKGNQWVGYDDDSIVRKKSHYVNEKNLGGIMFWSIDNDDFRGKCHSRPYPLIEAAKEALIGKAAGANQNKLPSAQRGGKGTAVKTSSKLKNHRLPATTSTTQATVTLSTPDPPTTPDPGSDFKCKDEGFFPHPRDCKKYFWCLDSGPSNLGIVAHQFTCPSGLFFNKAADSCDFARNVICKKKSSDSTTTTTTASPAKSTSGTKAVTTAKTTTTTTTTTTEAPLEEEEEYYEEQEDPQTIKQLISLIKKLGGVAELEKQLEGSNSGTDSTTPAISKSLYERVINKQTPRYQNLQRNGPTGPQNEGIARESGRSSSFRKEKPAYVTIRRERPTTEKIASEEFEEEEEAKVPEERPKYTPIQRNRGSQTEGREQDKTTERPKLRYQTVQRFKHKQQDNSRNPSDAADVEEEDQEATSEKRHQSSTLRYTNIFRSRSSPDTSTSTTSRYVTLQRQRPQPQESDDVGTTENELIGEEEMTEERIVDTTTTTLRPRLKVSDVLTTTPAVLTSTRVVTQVVEGATKRQRVPLHMLQQLLKDSENFVDSFTKPYDKEVTTEATTVPPRVSGFRTRRPIVVTTTVRTTPAYIALRRNRFRTSTTTEATETTTKHKGFVPSRTRGRITTESNEPQEDEAENEPLFRRRPEGDDKDEKPTRGFSSRRSTTTEPSQNSRFRNRFSARRSTTTTEKPTDDDEKLLTREYSRDTNVIRRPLLKPKFPSRRLPTSGTTEGSNGAQNVTESPTPSLSVETTSLASSTTTSPSSEQNTSEMIKDNTEVPTILEMAIESASDNVAKTGVEINETAHGTEIPHTTSSIGETIPTVEITTKQADTTPHHRFDRQKTKTVQIISTNETIVDSDIGNSNQVVRNKTKIILRRKKPSDEGSQANIIESSTHKPVSREKVIIRRKPQPTPKSLDIADEDYGYLENSVSSTYSPTKSRGRAKFATSIKDELEEDQTPATSHFRSRTSTEEKSSTRARTTNTVATTRARSRAVSDQGTTVSSKESTRVRSRGTSDRGTTVATLNKDIDSTETRYHHGGPSTRRYQEISRSTNAVVVESREGRSRTRLGSGDSRKQSLAEETVTEQPHQVRRRQRGRTSAEEIDTSVSTSKKTQVLRRGQKKFQLEELVSVEDIEAANVDLPRKQSSQSRNLVRAKDNANRDSQKKKIRTVVLRKAVKDLAVGESGIPDQETNINSIDEDPDGGSVKIYDSLINDDLVINFIQDAVQNGSLATTGEEEIQSRARKPFNRRTSTRSTTTTSTENPTTRQRTTAQILRQRLSRFKNERGQTLRGTTSTESLRTENEVTTIRPRRTEFRRVIRPSSVQNLAESHLDSSIEQSVAKDTVTRTNQFHRETSFRPQAHLKQTTQAVPRTVYPVEPSDYKDSVEGSPDLVTVEEHTSFDSEEGIPDLANVAVAAIQSLATSVPTKPTEQYVTTTVRPTFREIVITTHPPRHRQTRPHTLPPNTTPAIVPVRSVARSSPRPFSKVLPGAIPANHRPLRPLAAGTPLYEDYDDFYAEPIEIPLSGKVRIHNDGYIECLDIGNFPHPFSCRKFISCAKMENGHLLGWEYTCPKGLSFDPIGGICNWNAGLGCKE